jgi:hypothetical protein
LPLLKALYDNKNLWYYRGKRLFLQDFTKPFHIAVSRKNGGFKGFLKEERGETPVRTTR